MADYPLQGKYMLGKFKGGTEWIKPLAAHAAVHALYTFLILCFLNWKIALAAAAFDFNAHFVVDRIKASPNLLGRFKPHQKEFWWSLGADQSAHHLTHYLIIYFTITNL